VYHYLLGVNVNKP